MAIQQGISRWQLPRAWPTEFEHPQKHAGMCYLVASHKHVTTGTTVLDPLARFLEDYSSFGRKSIAAEAIARFCAGVDPAMLERHSQVVEVPSAWVHDERTDNGPNGTAKRETYSGRSMCSLLQWFRKQVSHPRDEIYVAL
jgi:hypothetical protein